MALWEVSFRSQYDYPFIRISGEHPGVPISMWCIWNRELLQVGSRSEPALKEIERGIRKAGRIVDEWIDVDKGRVFLLKCTCDRYRSVWNIADAHECIDAPPVVFQDGWGYFRVLSFDEGKTRALFREIRGLGPTELIRKRELPLSVLPSSIWVHTLFGDLSERQMQALLQAHRSGYYTSPRQVTTDHIARGVGVSRSTYEEHLRKAENRVMSALIPYLQIYGSAERPASKLPLRTPAGVRAAAS